MPHDNVCLIGSIGLQEHEVRLVKSILKHSNDRNPGRFDWTEGLNEAHLVIVSADNEDAMQEWNTLLSEEREAPVLLAITQKLNNSSSEYCLSRPFSPSRVIAILDKIFNEKLSEILESKIFASNEHSEQRVNILTVDDVTSNHLRALVVDDSPTVRKQLELELESFKIKVDLAETGEQCMSMLERDAYDIIFLDVILPGIDGYEVCKKIRKNLETRRTPVVMLTSKSSSFDRVRGAMAGCSTYLTKPVDYEKFHMVLKEYLSNE